ncbi:MAG: hypothetical protein WDN24_12185 [Sphingomonas sp.]
MPAFEGIASVTTIEALPAGIDLAILALPAAAILDAVRCLRRARDRGGRHLRLRLRRAGGGGTRRAGRARRSRARGATWR